MVAPIRGKCAMVYDMGLEPTNVQMVFHTEANGIRARGTERYDPPIHIRYSLLFLHFFFLISCLCVRVQCIITRKRPLGTKAIG